MRRAILFVCLMFCGFSGIFAQIQDENGKVVLRTGEIRIGKINYYLEQPLDIIITDSNGVKSDFDPSHIRQIILNNGEKYVSKTIIGKQDSSVLIFQVLIESSKISLFVRDEKDEKQFYVLKDNALYDLVNNEQIIKTNDGTYKSYDKKYIGVMKTLMSDQPDIVKRLDKVRLYEDELVEVITAYDKGELTYFWQSNNKVTREPYWAVFGQYSNYGSYEWGQQCIYPSYGFVAGFQYYFSKKSRHSLRFTVDYSNYNETSFNSMINQYISGITKTYSLGCRYEYDFVRANKYSIYLMMHIADITYFSETDPKDKGFTFCPRLSPGVGFEVKPFKHVALFAELNNCFEFRYLPASFSAGLKYDLCKTNW
jgi:hypothetical protein